MRVTGGMPPEPRQETWPVAQSPVAHENFPEASVEQSVRTHMRPAHLTGTVIEREAEGASWKPVFESGRAVGLDSVVGHTVWRQLFLKVNVAERPPEIYV